MFSAMQKTWNPVIKMEFTTRNVTEFAKFWMDTSKEILLNVMIVLVLIIRLLLKHHF